MTCPVQRSWSFISIDSLLSDSAFSSNSRFGILSYHRMLMIGRRNLVFTLLDVTSLGGPCLAPMQKWGKENGFVDFQFCCQPNALLLEYLHSETSKVLNSSRDLFFIWSIWRNRAEDGWFAFSSVWGCLEQDLSLPKADGQSKESGRLVEATWTSFSLCALRVQ